MPVIRLFKPNDHVYTSIDTEVADFVSMGYGNEGIEFYCASQQTACGASLALHRFLNNGQNLSRKGWEFIKLSFAIYGQVNNVNEL